MLTIEEIKRALHDRHVATVSMHTGVNRNTIQHIKTGAHTNPTAKTMRLLSDYLAPEYLAPESKGGE
jgi:hypothetical protein